ncbi:hypothetical protein EDB85DRAFT_1893196 [Lactarius pseudohatsudake]|nr:hypothetical protein EDB85DRAFT_1893196 [Lactarius pseudohatsudake]
MYAFRTSSQNVIPLFQGSYLFTNLGWVPADLSQGKCRMIVRLEMVRWTQLRASWACRSHINISPRAFRLEDCPARAPAPMGGCRTLPPKCVCGLSNSPSTRNADFNVVPPSSSLRRAALEFANDKLDSILICTRLLQMSCWPGTTGLPTRAASRIQCRWSLTQLVVWTEIMVTVVGWAQADAGLPTNAYADNVYAYVRFAIRTESRTDHDAGVPVNTPFIQHQIDVGRHVWIMSHSASVTFGKVCTFTEVTFKDKDEAHKPPSTQRASRSVNQNRSLQVTALLSVLGSVWRREGRRPAHGSGSVLALE